MMFRGAVKLVREKIALGKIVLTNLQHYTARDERAGVYCVTVTPFDGVQHSSFA